MYVKKYEQGFRKLFAWQEALKLTVMIYRITASFPQEERYGLTSQLRRASSSTKAQIAEGSRMSTQAHKRSYYERSYASNAEVDSFIELAKELDYINQTTHEELLNQINKLGFLIHKLVASCK